MTEGAQKRLGFSAIGGRKAKAEKISAILAAAGCPLKPDSSVLDLGCGSGEIAAELATLARVSCADAVDQRVLGRDLPFRAVNGKLPFDDGAFDVVISNHVIEHVVDAAAHLREVRRVLHHDGVCYLATPNRWWPWEVHAHLPLLHYLPAARFSRLAMDWGRLPEPVHLLSLKDLCDHGDDGFTIEPWHPRILHDPERFALNLPSAIATALRLIPQSLLNATAGLQPTLILLLRAR